MSRTSHPTPLVAVVTAVVLTAAAAFAGPAMAENSGEQFITSATEHSDNTATFPLKTGRTTDGRTVHYIVLDSSNGNDADARGVNKAPKLANARGTDAVKKVTIDNGMIVFPGTVDFSPVHHVVAGPGGFPPAAADPGAVGEDGASPRTGYSPLIELPNGTVLNAPHVANGSGEADKVVALDKVNRRVRYRETNGFSRGDAVKYVSTDASDPAVAALEESTFVADLAHAPVAGGDGTDSARASLAAFVNGQTGISNPQRQGLNSALLDGADPLNVLFWKPNQGRYSPLWDVFAAQWSSGRVAAGQNLRQRDFGDIIGLADHGQITGPGGAPFGPLDVVVDCPIVSSN